MAAEAVAHSWLVDVALYLCRIFVGVAVEAELVGNGRDQLHPRDVFIDPHLVTAQASHLDCGVN